MERPDPDELDLGVDEARITTIVDVAGVARPQAGGDGRAPVADRRRLVLPRAAADDAFDVRRSAPSGSSASTRPRLRTETWILDELG